MWYSYADASQVLILDPRIINQYDKYNKDPSNDLRWGTDEHENNIKYFLGVIFNAYERTKDPKRSANALFNYFKSLKFAPSGSDKPLFDEVIREFELKAKVEVGEITSQSPPSSTGSVTVDYDNDAAQNKDVINPIFLREIEEAAESAGITYFRINSIFTGHPTKAKSGNISRHSRGQAMDLGRFNRLSPGSAEFKELGDKFVAALRNKGYKFGERGQDTQRSYLWWVSDHYDHIHVSNIEFDPANSMAGMQPAL